MLFIAVMICTLRLNVAVFFYFLGSMTKHRKTKTSKCQHFETPTQRIRPNLLTVILIICRTCKEEN